MCYDSVPMSKLDNDYVVSETLSCIVINLPTCIDFSFLFNFEDLIGPDDLINTDKQLTEDITDIYYKVTNRQS